MHAEHVLVAATVVAALVLMAGCRPRVDNDMVVDTVSATAPTSISGTADTLRGVVVETGAAPITTLMLRPSAGDVVALRGPSMPLLRRTVGLEVVVEGQRTRERDMAAGPRGAPIFEADGFIVRAADGIAAHDGIVVVERRTYWLTLHDGRKVAAEHMPAALRAKPGARVFLAGPLDRPPAAYGIIQDAR